MDKIIIPRKNSSDIYLLSEIEYLSSTGCYTNIHLVDKSKIISSKPLAYYEGLLSDFGFLRIHQKYLVNKECIKTILNGKPLKIKLKSETILTVTRYKKFELYQMFLY